MTFITIKEYLVEYGPKKILMNWSLLSKYFTDDPNFLLSWILNCNIGNIPMNTLHTYIPISKSKQFLEELNIINNICIKFNNLSQELIQKYINLFDIDHKHGQAFHCLKDEIIFELENLEIININIKYLEIEVKCILPKDEFLEKIKNIIPIEFIIYK